MANDQVHAVVTRRGFGWRRLLVAPWALVGLAALALAVRDPSPTSLAIPVLLGILFAVTIASQRASRSVRRRGLRDLQLRLDNATYLNEFQNLPNRNYMLDQLRREMPRARASREPFVLVVVTIENLESVAARRGADFAERCTRSLASLIERFTRASDFAAELAPGSFGILLYDCGADMAGSYIRRIPGVLAVSTGKQMLDIPLVVRMSEYDLESLYAIDVLREAEEDPPVRDPEVLRFGAEAA